mmetsp:Transcript_38250/g.92938  ORF Transcript_38250/g.92938 Transcript_38250/m.92938 type:complete len:94 (+) Transcript_38250:711-992(+)
MPVAVLLMRVSLDTRTPIKRSRRPSSGALEAEDGAGAREEAGEVPTLPCRAAKVLASGQKVCACPGLGGSSGEVACAIAIAIVRDRARISYPE